MTYATKTDVEDVFEGDFATVRDSRVQHLLDTAVARLNLLIPDLVERVKLDSNLQVLARDIVVQAVLRQLYNPRSELVQQSQSAGPFGFSQNVGSGNSRGNRGLFYDEELDLLRPPSSGLLTGTIHLGLSAWGR